MEYKPMMIRWFTRFKKYRPVIEITQPMGVHVSVGERYDVTMETDSALFFIGDFEKEIYLHKSEEGKHFIYVKKGLEDIYP